MTFAFTKFDPHAFLENAIQEAGPSKPAKPAKALERQPETLATLAVLAGGHPYARIFAALCERCPDYIEADRWQQAVHDSRCFLAKWGDKAAALGWTPQDLFGLHTPPEQPHPSYDRLGRYDQIGLVWLLNGRLVVALTETSAAVQTSGGTSLVYRRAR